MAIGKQNRCAMRRQVTRTSLCALLALAVVNSAQSQERTPRIPRPRETPPPPRFISQFGIDEAMLESLCVTLNLDAEQRLEAQRLHAKYVAGAEQYSKELYQRMLDGGLQEYWDAYADARDAGEPMPVERMNRLHQQYSRIRYEGYPYADQQVADFYESVEKILTPAQHSRIEVARRLMRRLNWYQRETSDRPPRAMRSEFDLSLVDPFSLWTEAIKDWREQSALCCVPCVSSLDVTDPSTLADDDPLRAACQRLRKALEAYEVQIDVVVRDGMDERRRPPNPNRPATAPVDSPKFERRIARWSEEHRTLDRCMHELTEVARSLKGDEAADALHGCYLEALCPGLVAECWPDRMVEWLGRREDNTTEQLDAARDLYASYKKEMRHLTKLAVEAGIAAKRKHLFQDGDEPEQDEFEARIDDMRALVERTLIAYRGLLRADQIGDFDDQVFADLFLHNGELGGPGGGGLERLRELLKPPTSVDELYRRGVERHEHSEND